MIVLDTDVMIELLAKREPTTGFLGDLRDQGQSLATTSVSAGELLRGAHDDPEARDKALTMLRALSEVPVGARAARRYGEIMHTLDRAGTRISAADGLIAAATLEAGGRLTTRNVRDFDRVAALEVLVPE